MPGLDGMALARVISRFSVRPQIVFVTAHDEHAVPAFEEGAVDYLVKPVDVDRFDRAVGRPNADRRALLVLALDVGDVAVDDANVAAISGNAAALAVFWVADDSHAVKFDMMRQLVERSFLGRAELDDVVHSLHGRPELDADEPVMVSSGNAPKRGGNRRAHVQVLHLPLVDRAFPDVPGEATELADLAAHEPRRAPAALPADCLRAVAVA